MSRHLAAATTLALALAPALASGAPKSFDELFAPLAHGGCIAMSEVRAAGAVVELTPEQFQFVRAFWMATPPQAFALPPGDKAFATRDSEGDAVFGLYDNSGATCVVFRGSAQFGELVDQVGRGEVGTRGDGT